MNIILNKLFTSFSKYIHRHDVDTKTGLSLAERKRVLLQPWFVQGYVNMFGRKFMYQDSRSFYYTNEHIFGHEIYKFNTQSPKPYIIDCGANMGLGTYYFFLNYPQAEIIAFEPDEETFNVLKNNVEQLMDLNRVKIFQKAVWKEETTLDFFSDKGMGSNTLFEVEESVLKTKVKTVDLKSYLDRKVDFLKMDIEGGENILFFDIIDYLENVENFFLEFHGLKEERQNLGDILNALTNKGFRYYIKQAADIMPYPYIADGAAPFNQQLNIFCFRRK